MGSCTDDFWKCVLDHGDMKADSRISVKDLNRGKTLKILLSRLPFQPRHFRRRTGPAESRGIHPLILIVAEPGDYEL
jgi:hypothetical protein